MGLRRYGNRRDENERAIIAALEAMGCAVHRMDKPCDLLVLARGTVHLCEVKTKRGQLTKAQERFAEHWPIRILRSVEDAVSLAGGRVTA